MTQYRTVEGEGSATANTLTALTTFGADTAVGPVKVPAGASKLVELWFAVGADLDTAGDTCAHILRLAGKGLKNGDQDFLMGAVAGGVTTTGTIWSPAMVYKVNVDVVPNENIAVQHAYTGDTTGAATLGVTLVFE